MDEWACDFEKKSVLKKRAPVVGVLVQTDRNKAKLSKDYIKVSSNVDS